MASTILTAAETGKPGPITWKSGENRVIPYLLQEDPWLCIHPQDHTHSHDRAACIAGHIADFLVTF